jgi:DNA polymerase (family X)
MAWAVPFLYNKGMDNRDLERTFLLISNLLEIKGENIYKIIAYRKAADSLANLSQDVNELARTNQLSTIPGVGKAIAEKIDELLTTGRLGFLEKLEAEVPESLAEMLSIPDVGPKKVALFWREAGITNVAQLEAAAKDGRLRGLAAVGEKSEQRILAGIEAYKRRSQGEQRASIGKAYPYAQELLAWLRNIPEVQCAEMGGSLRRMRATIGDIDLVAATLAPQAVMQAFINHPQVAHVRAQGETKSSVEFRNGLPAQLWLHRPDQFGTAWQYATGSKGHNVRLRELAQSKGLSLSDQSLLQPDGTEKFLATEEEVYSALGMPWIPPEMREDHGEIEAALRGQSPTLIERSDLVAELHSHTTWSDGNASIREMAEAARQRGYRVLAITDHSNGLGIVGGMDASAIQRRLIEIQQVQIEMGDSIRILSGAEVEIRSDGRLDYPDEVLAGLDIVIASLHSSLRQPREVITERLLSAMRNPHVDIIGHPTGRLMPEREGADLDMDAVLITAKETHVVLEINSHPARLDLDDVHTRRAKEMGILLSIGTDAHSPHDLDLVIYGLAVARRGWLESRDVINTWSPERLVEWLRTPRPERNNAPG